MPHQCVRCSKMYVDGSENLLKGCECGARIFFFIKKEKLEQAKKRVVALTSDEKEQIEQDVYEMLDITGSETPVILDFESINVLKPGKYEIDLVQLFKGEPLVFKLQEGKYIIDLAETFRKFRK